MKMEDEGMPITSAKTRQMIVLGVIILACVGAVIGQSEAIPIAIGGLLALVKGDD